MAQSSHGVLASVEECGRLFFLTAATACSPAPPPPSYAPQAGADPWKVLRQMRDKLRLNCAAVQVPCGHEDALEGLVDLVGLKAWRFGGPNGEQVVEVAIPADLQGEVQQRRMELIEHVAGVAHKRRRRAGVCELLPTSPRACCAEVDEELGELFLMEEPIDAAALRAAVRRCAHAAAGQQKGGGGGAPAILSRLAAHAGLC